MIFWYGTKQQTWHERLACLLALVSLFLFLIPLFASYPWVLSDMRARARR